ncbi:MAG: VOC family protein [Candidatus Poribacteria bacterium]|nr:VOC family protein [Candidatus Poribacteria bacterium]
MGNPVRNFEIVGDEGKSLSEFYSKVFDWKMNEYEVGYYGFKTGTESDRGIEGHMYPPNDEIPLVDDVPFGNNVTIYVVVDDIHATLEKLDSIGGKTLMPPTVVSEKGEQLAMFLDPEGNRIGLYQPN